MRRDGCVLDKRKKASLCWSMNAHHRHASTTTTATTATAATTSVVMPVVGHLRRTSDSGFFQTNSRGRVFHRRCTRCVACSSSAPVLTYLHTYIVFSATRRRRGVAPLRAAPLPYPIKVRIKVVKRFLGTISATSTTCWREGGGGRGEKVARVHHPSFREKPAFLDCFRHRDGFSIRRGSRVR